MDRHSVQWRGYIPAITTPFTSEGALDMQALERLLQWLLDAGYEGAFDLELLGPRIEQEGNLQAAQRAVANLSGMLNALGA